ncbi:dihydrolipoamide acetyltransferase family protein [Salinicoccus carnicancri]|uniref:dihydrolipoamide acetyltransferase family protein n=1 Tax=Salinicoccus carnicancri TaxID=558170 RepID=UPI0002D324CB|nr:dihydrolipoamide acetyltransferase family protein [Salinicoccus carnicancri]
MPNEIFMPKLSSTMAEGTVIEWFKDEGETVEIGEPILEIMTDKINIEVEAYHEGILLKTYFGADDVVPVNHVIGYIGEEGEGVPDTAPGLSSEASAEETGGKGSREDNAASSDTGTPEEKAPSKSDRTVSGTRENSLGKVRATPAARALARNEGIDIHDVSGSGRNGRIHKQDVADHTSGSEEHQKTPVNHLATGVRTEKLKGARKTVADRMADSSTSIPHVTIDFEVEMDNLIDLRNRVNQQNPDDKVSFSDLFILITSRALNRHPEINITFENDVIQYHDARNIGLAVAVDKELLVPVIKNTESKSLLSIRDDSKELISKARDGKLIPAEMQGGTFTISNLGMYSIRQFTPIINKPQAGILGIGGTMDRPAVHDGRLINKKAATFSLSFDHRGVNGAPAAAFCNTVKHLAENPVELIL